MYENLCVCIEILRYFMFNYFRYFMQLAGIRIEILFVDSGQHLYNKIFVGCTKILPGHLKCYNIVIFVELKFMRQIEI